MVRGGRPLRVITLAALGCATVGCYTLKPTFGAVPEPGTMVALKVNDAGRVALGGAVGPEIDQIEGRLVSRENDEYLLAVQSIRTIRGMEQVWSGEKVPVKTEHVAAIYERQFSRGRTMALAAVGVGGVAAFILTRSLIAAGEDISVDPSGGGTTLTRIRP